MTDTKALLELAARCEAAEGPDRELDAEIAAAAGIIDNIPDYLRGPLGVPYYRVSEDGRRVVYGTHHNDKDHRLASREPRPFTASLDAALTLVPEGWCIASLEWWPMSSIKAGVTLREVREFGGDYPRTGYDETCGDARSHAATPALALCAASLRAIAQEQSK